jgi:hypothetical protein
MLDPFSRCKFELERTLTILDVKVFALARASWTSGMWNKVCGGSSFSIWWRSLLIPDPERRRRDGDGERLSRSPEGPGESA